MAESFDEELVDRIRNKLNAEKIKLWLPPYTTDEGEKGEVPQDFLAKFNQGFGLSPEELLRFLEDLRQHALKKLAAKRKFQEEGIATLTVRLAGMVTDDMKQYSKGAGLGLEISLHSTGNDLKYNISSKTNIAPEKLKLICRGKLVEDGSSLQDQKVKHSHQIMALCLSESQAGAIREQNTRQSVAKTREAAEILAAHQDGGQDDTERYYLQIADQSGKPIDLPPEERKALVLAMTLHEKGRAALKRKNYSEALLLLLEADSEFIKCRADILTAVDNFALVCLDIVWCYLLLKNVDGLPDAASRLQACDACFKRTYGSNLERLTLVKGGTGSEIALFMRLHLLQAILAYHQKNMYAAKSLMEKASAELRRLTVNEDDMTQVMAMGFTSQEARVALRLCEGNVSHAVSHIMKRREEKKDIKHEEKEKKRKRKLQRHLGKTASGDDVDVDKYEQLISMGFSEGASAEALRQANNDLGQSLQVLQDHPELLSLPNPNPPAFSITDEMLAIVTSMGFDNEAARAALNHFQGGVEQAVEQLLSRGGVIPQEWLDSVPSTSSGSSSGGSSPADPAEAKAKEEEKQRQKEAEDAIIPDIPEGDEDYLDLTLEEEAAVLAEYTALIVSHQDTK